MSPDIYFMISMLNKSKGLSKVFLIIDSNKLTEDECKHPTQSRKKFYNCLPPNVKTCGLYQDEKTIISIEQIDLFAIVE